MKNLRIGLEYEFFVETLAGIVVAAREATYNTDGNPVVGEVRTSVCDNMVDAVFDLRKRIYLEEQALNKKGFRMANTHEITVNDEFLRDCRRTGYDIKKMENLTELSIYPTGQLGKFLPREVFKASLQVNMSSVRNIYYSEAEKIDVGSKSMYRAKSSHIVGSQAFDYITPIAIMDKTFKDDIEYADRVKGVYAIKDGIGGNRVEYRSLPNFINLDTLINIFK